jgi:DNA polymerase-4
MFDRAIVHMDLDAFFVSVECLRNSELKGKPLIIGGTSNRGVVSSCSYEARRFGVHSAMPMKMALKLCPQAKVLRGDMEAYSKYSHLVTEVIEDQAPVFEKASIDEFYLDISGMDKYFGCYQWTQELRQMIIKETGLPISFGLSANKLVSKVGTGESKPNGQLQIAYGQERPFLSPLSIKKIPGVGKATYQQLSFMGVRKVKVLADMPRTLLERTFGKSGGRLWEKANAIDHTPVVPYREQKSMSKERTLKEDTLDLDQIRSMIIRMAEQLAFELRSQERLSACITIKIRYADFNTYTKQKRIPYTAKDKDIMRIALELFESLYTRRQLIRLIGLRLSDLVSGSPQLRFFEDSEKDIRLMEEMDQLRNRFGVDAVMRASGVTDHRPRTADGTNQSDNGQRTADG